MTIWLAVPVWPIWRASGCSAWGEIMMGCLGKNHNQSETIMQNYVCLSPSTGLKGWETPQINQAMRMACYSSCIRQLILPANLGSSGWMGVYDAWIVALLWGDPFCKARFLQKKKKKKHAHTVISYQNQYHKTNDECLSWNTTLETWDLLTWECGECNFLLQWR